MCARLGTIETISGSGSGEKIGLFLLIAQTRRACTDYEEKSTRSQILKKKGKKPLGGE